VLAPCDRPFFPDPPWGLAASWRGGPLTARADVLWDILSTLLADGELLIVLRNLQRNLTRTLLTLIGVSVGMSAFVAFSCIRDSMVSQFKSVLNTWRVDIIVQAKGAANPLHSSIAMSEYQRLATAVAGIEEISAMLIGTTLVGATDIPGLSQSILIGISSIDHLGGRIGFVQGGPFTSGRGEAVLGQQAAREIGCKPGDEILVAEHIFRVTGICASGSAIFDGAVVMDWAEARNLLNRDDRVNLAFIRVAEAASVQNVIREIKSQFPNLSAVQQGEFLGHLRLLRTVDQFAQMIVAVTVLVTVVIVVNTLVLSISERRKEIGILMAVGWSRGRVMAMVFQEAVLICLGGGVAGCLLSLCLLWFFQYRGLIGSGWMRIPITIPLELFLSTMGLSLLLGVCSGAYPAFIASRHFPIEALRSQ
jgi:putative ABC transport system permease protein